MTSKENDGQRDLYAMRCDAMKELSGFRTSLRDLVRL